MDRKKYFIYTTVILTIIVLLTTGCTQNNSIGEKNDTGDKITEVEEDLNKNTDHKDDEVDKIKLEIEKMTLEEKIGQLVLVGMEGYEINDNIKDLIENYHAGGIILYGKNVKDSNQLLSLINSLKDVNSSNKVPLFFSVDEEGGGVSRNPSEVKKLPSARTIGATKDKSLAFEAGRLLGQTVKSFGYNMNFAPVLDIDSNPINPVIGNRSYSTTAEIVSTMGIEVMSGIEDEGVIPVIKHFPGHGDTEVDSHIGLPIIDHDLERISSLELVPFKEAIDNGADMVMVAHILMSQIDAEYPASMSSAIINDILRDELEFKGVVITDDITMGAIEENYSIEEAAIKSLEAGSDIILVGHGYEKAVTVLNAIKQEVELRNISLEKIDESVYRVLKLKKEYKLEDSLIEHINIQPINEKINQFITKIN